MSVGIVFRIACASLRSCAQFFSLGVAFSPRPRSEGGKRKSLRAVFFRACFSSVVDRNTWACSGKKGIGMKFTEWNEKIRGQKMFEYTCTLVCRRSEKGKKYVAKVCPIPPLREVRTLARHPDQFARSLSSLLPLQLLNAAGHSTSPPPTPTIPRLPHEKDRPKKLSFQIVKADVSHIC